MKFLAFLFTALLFTPLHAHAQIKVENISDNYHVLFSESGGNVVVSVGEDGVFMIDDQLAGQSEAIKESVKTLTDKNVSFILNTHYHFDHTGNNEAFGSDGAIILSHNNVRKRLSSDQFITHFQKNFPALSEDGLPVITFSQDMDFYYNDDEIHMTYVPNAHTDGDAIAVIKSDNIIVAGDIIFNGLYPFIDIEHGGSVKGILTGLDKIIKLSDENTVIVPGHGSVMNVEDVKAYKNMLETILSEIEKGIQNGKTEAEIIAAQPTKEFDEKNEQAVVKADALVSMFYAELTKK